ncbi:MAG TPA: metalloregulator ArsR/SmtB family transcription factor [Nocardioidaceae bacterium]|nr:metalloregulator ArsR/SmtB family transcription factor [Nocardioidaceae bacterium]
MSLEVSSLRALAHPVRLQILSLLTGTSMSAADIARQLDITQANASYHLRQLAAVGEVVEAGERKIRGGTAKLYRHPWEERAHQDRSDAGSDDKQLYLQAFASEMVRRYATYEPGQGAFTDAELWVDPDVWSDVVEATGEASMRLHRAAQPPGTEGTVRVSMTTALFRMHQTDPKSEGES